MTDLDTALDRLVDRGVLSRDQADAVRTEMTAPTPVRATQPWVEVLAYLGATLAAASALVLASEVWDLLPPAARTGLTALTAALLVAGGWWVVGSETPTARRLVSVLWLLAAGSAAWAAWLLADEVLRWAPESAALSTGLVLLVGGSLLWRRHRRSLQQIPVLVGALLTGVSVLDHALDAPRDLPQVLAWGLGAAWAFAAVGGLVRPERTGIVLGGLLSLLGAQVLAWHRPALGIGLALVTAGAAFAGAAVARRPLLAGLGVATLVVFLPQAVLEWFEATLAVPLALLVTGIALLGGSLATFRMAARPDR